MTAVGGGCCAQMPVHCTACFDWVVLGNSRERMGITRLYIAVCSHANRPSTFAFVVSYRLGLSRQFSSLISPRGNDILPDVPFRCPRSSHYKSQTMTIPKRRMVCIA